MDIQLPSPPNIPLPASSPSTTQSPAIPSSSSSSSTGFFNPTIAPRDEVVEPGQHPDVEMEGLGRAPQWLYEMRRDCQQVATNVYLGPLAVAKDLAKLQSLKITHVVYCREQREVSYLRPYFPDHFQYTMVELRDHPDESVITKLMPGITFMCQALDQGGSVYVHDLNGIGQSAVLVVGFLMFRYQLTADQALAHLQKRRYCVAMNGGFVRQLKEFEPIYKAKLAMSSNPYIGFRNQSSGNPTKTAVNGSNNGIENKNGQAMQTDTEPECQAKVKSKRDLDDVYDDMDLDDAQEAQPVRVAKANSVWMHNGQVKSEEDRWK